MGNKITDYKQHIRNNVKEEWCESLQSYCWIWQLACNDSGYGIVRKAQVNTRIHRIAYAEFIGPIPEGLDICHKCDMPACCNPDHLYPGTEYENMNDMVSRNRQSKGSKRPAHKLLEHQIPIIRQKYATGNYTQKQLAIEYNVSRSLIGCVVTGKLWKHSSLS